MVPFRYLVKNRQYTFCSQAGALNFTLAITNVYVSKVNVTFEILTYQFSSLLKVSEWMVTRCLLNVVLSPCVTIYKCSIASLYWQSRREFDVPFCDCHISEVNPLTPTAAI